MLGPIRPGRAEAERLASIARAAFQDGGRGWGADDILAFSHMPGALIIADGGLSQGAILLRVAGGEAEILDLGVVPACRRRGLARVLLASAEHAVRAAGATRIVLEVATDNAAALALYRAEGYAEAGRRPRYYRRVDGARADALILARALPRPACPAPGEGLGDGR